MVMEQSELVAGYYQLQITQGDWLQQKNKRQPFVKTRTK
jgi:hypothetical protein